MSQGLGLPLVHPLAGQKTWTSSLSGCHCSSNQEIQTYTIALINALFLKAPEDKRQVSGRPGRDQGESQRRQALLPSPGGWGEPSLGCGLAWAPLRAPPPSVSCERLCIPPLTLPPPSLLIPSSAPFVPVSAFRPQDQLASPLDLPCTVSRSPCQGREAWLAPDVLFQGVGGHGRHRRSRGAARAGGYFPCGVFASLAGRKVPPLALFLPLPRPISLLPSWQEMADASAQKQLRSAILTVRLGVLEALPR